MLGEGNGTPLQYSCLENRMDRGAWWAAVHGVAKSWTWLSDFTFTFHFHALEKEMATHSSVLAWRIPGTGQPGGLPSMGSHRVGHDWGDSAAAAAPMLCTTFIHLSWRLQGSPTLSRGGVTCTFSLGQPRVVGIPHLISRPLLTSGLLRSPWTTVQRIKVPSLFLLLFSL